MEKHYAIGVMSGTSLDGLDLAWCSFEVSGSEWKYNIHHAETIPYSTQWEERLRQAPSLGGKELIELHYQYGHYTGQMVEDFIKRNSITIPGIIASHGHTVFHRPELGYTFQAGNGAAIAARTGLTVVCDFRSTDVALGGQGAPLVPIGDHHLFADFTYCLNLGGFANISFEQNGQRVAFDICPVNFVINKIIREAAIPAADYLQHLPSSHSDEGFLHFDPSGEIAKKGTIDNNLLEQLNNLAFYNSTGPRSLGEEWVVEHFLPLIKEQIPTQDLLRTLYEHISLQVAGCIPGKTGENILVTGGGAYNDFLISLIREKVSAFTPLIIPTESLIDYKEALVFAFLGILRMHNMPNSLSAVTGSQYNNIGGCIFNGSKDPKQISF